MRVSDDVLKCVFFLAVKATTAGTESFRLVGTGFFVGVPSERFPQEAQWTYMATAKHVIEAAKRYGSSIYVRLNTNQGGYEMLEVHGEWTYHENEGVDLALGGWQPDLKKYDCRVIPFEMFALEKAIESESIGVGDEIVMVGLFSQHYGTKKNYPIVRSGAIAATPGEPLRDDHSGVEYQAYLAEVRSIGGLSGSPVFVALTQLMLPSGISRKREKFVYLLGVVRGHWDIKKVEAAVDFAEDDLGQVNMGIAIVTPVQYLAEMLMYDVFLKPRRNYDSEVAKTRESKPPSVQ